MEEELQELRDLIAQLKADNERLRQERAVESDEFFMFTSSSAVPLIIGLAVSLAVSIILNLIGVFLIWIKIKTNVWKPHCLRKKQETTKTEPDQEQETLMTQDIEPSGGPTTLTKHQQLMEQNMKEEESNKTELEKNQHAAEEKLKEEHHHLQKKHAEISNMKKEPETSKHKTQRKSQRNFQEQNKSSSANHSSARGDIILDKVDKLGTYICLKNTSSENKLMGDWEVKLQVNETQPVTYKVETNFTLKAGERLTLQRVGARSPYPDDAEMMWMGMTDWDYRDDLKISLLSNTGEEHRLK